jgi:hypothetical protein
VSGYHRLFPGVRPGHYGLHVAEAIPPTSTVAPPELIEQDD